MPAIKSQFDSSLEIEITHLVDIRNHTAGVSECVLLADVVVDQLWQGNQTLRISQTGHRQTDKMKIILIQKSCQQTFHGANMFTNLLVLGVVVGGPQVSGGEELSLTDGGGFLHVLPGSWTSITVLEPNPVLQTLFNVLDSFHSVWTTTTHGSRTREKINSDCSQLQNTIGKDDSGGLVPSSMRRNSWVPGTSARQRT